jgi:hypothetical protein
MERVKIHFLISLVSMGSIKLCCGQCVAHELQDEQALFLVYTISKGFLLVHI